VGTGRSRFGPVQQQWTGMASGTLRAPTAAGGLGSAQRNWYRCSQREATVKKFSLLSALATILASVSPAVGQYGAPPPPGVWVTPNAAPGNTAPGYRWREQRSYEDPRRNSNTSQQPSENYQRTPTIPTEGRAVTDPGECAIGVSEETCRRRGQKYNPPKN
jgi:hypothetical protein